MQNGCSRRQRRWLRSGSWTAPSRRVVEYRRIDRATLENATALQQRKGTRLGEVLIEAGLACSNTGYRGRLGLHELLVADDGIKRAIQRKSSVEELRNLAVAGGMTTLLQDGISKVLSGHTDLKQVLAVCSR
ncbi:MAG: hypothetical protein JW940_01395 [Polyangiaceae bacterium]|nr:hypothetical protein [Polyangiaceae bacterium]